MIVAFANQKGGVAKTTTTLNIGGYLAKRKRRVLLIDADPQGSLSVYMGINTGGMDEVMEGRSMADIVETVREGLDLAPASIQLATAELHLMAGFNREYRLRNALVAIKDKYDDILIDCPPSLGLLTINALAAAEAVAIVMSCDVLAFEGVKLLYESLRATTRQINPNLAILGLIRTRFDARTTHSSMIASKAAELLGPHMRVFETLISERTALRDSAAAKQLIYEYAPNSPAAMEYSRLGEEVYHATA